jgi:hypothetical protein
MTIGNAATLYYLRTTGLSTHYVAFENSKMLSPRVAILKNESNQRLACIIETKKGYTIDLAKRMHNIVTVPKNTRPMPNRDAQGRFVKGVQ